MKFTKQKHFFVRYLITLILTIVALAFWIFFLFNNPGSKTGDIILVAFFFAALVSWSTLLLVLYLLRPKTLLSYDDLNVYIHLRKSKTKTLPFHNLTSIGKIRRNLVFVTKDNDLVLVRFLTASEEVITLLQAGLNNYIRDNPDHYFANNVLAAKDEQKDNVK